MSGRKKTLNFSNSRIHFGNLIYEAAKQGDYEGLELILSQDGGMDFWFDLSLTCLYVIPYSFSPSLHLSFSL